MAGNTAGPGFWSHPTAMLVFETDSHRDARVGAFGAQGRPVTQ
jgi:hypothetical protein